MIEIKNYTGIKLPSSSEMKQNSSSKQFCVYVHMVGVNSSNERIRYSPFPRKLTLILSA